jgi:predicted alpha/beta-hydrolase family hydrolase
MAQSDQWDIIGHDSAPVPNRFFATEGGNASKLALLLPGIRYTNDRPLLYYSRQLCQEHGHDALALDYQYGFDQRFQQLSQSEREEWMRADLAALQERLNSADGYDTVTIVAKSLGTLLVSRLLATGIKQSVRVVWLTPVLSDEGVTRTLNSLPQPSYLVMGTADPYYNAESLKGVRQNRSVEVREVDGADHSLEIPSDVEASVRVLKEYISGLTSFLGG